MEFALLAVELVLLIVTIALLMLSRREWRGRERLLRRLAETIRALTR